jgi:hypothetical protein
MAWTSPATFASGQIVTSSDLNIQVRCYIQSRLGSLSRSPCRKIQKRNSNENAKLYP